MRDYQESIENFRLQVLADREKHTFKRNGLEIRAEQVITEFLNHRSELIKKVLF